MRCRAGCGACCIAVSISSAIPGMAEGKPAGIRCVQLSHDNLCRLYGHPDRPAICAAMQANVETCGMSAQEAFANLLRLEVLTRPEAAIPGRRGSREVAGWPHS